MMWDVGDEYGKQIREAVNDAVYENAKRLGLSVYDICFRTVPRIHNKMDFDTSLLKEPKMSVEFTVELDPVEFELEKGPGYWKNKYYRLKEKMQEIINDKNDGCNGEL